MAGRPDPKAIAPLAQALRHRTDAEQSLPRPADRSKQQHPLMPIRGVSFSLRRHTAMSVVMYVERGCPYCQAAREHLALTRNTV
jgi:hypothetical protein